MARRRNIIAIPSLGSLDKAAGRVGQQLTQALREAISNGMLKPGERLPSTRALAASLQLARGTVIEALGQLHAEGYLEARARGGTIVANVNGGRELVSPPQAFIAPPRIGPVLRENVARLAEVAQALRPQGTAPFAIAHPAGAVAPG